MIRFLFLICILLTGGYLSAQEVKIKAIDSGTGESIPYANVCFETLADHQKDYLITNLDGEVSVSLSQKMIISISCLGFETIIDTLKPGIVKKEYKLQTSTHEINTVVVTGQLKPVRVDKSIYDIKLIGKDRIESKAATNLADVLVDEPGVRLSHDPSTGTSLRLQGVTGENIKILIDGVPVIGRLDGNIDLSQITLDNVSHIEIVEGPMSVVYGSNALGGVINIITDKSTHARYKTSVNSYYESVGTYNFNFLTSFRHSKNNFEFNGGRNFFGGYSEDNTRYKRWKPKEQLNAGFTYNYNSEKTRARFKTNYFRERLLDKSNPFAPYFEMANNTWFKTHRVNNSLEVVRNFGDNSNFDLMLSYSYYKREKQKYLIDLTTLDEILTASVSDHDTSTFDALVARGIYNYAPDGNALSFQAGFDINVETADGKRIEGSHENIGDYAAFASAMWKPIDDFTLQPGIRAAYNTKYDAPLSPSLNMMFKTGKTTFRSSYARGFRSPSLKELYLYFFDSNHQVEGNDELEAERSHNFILSAGHKTSHRNLTIIFDAKTFYNLIDNKISLIQVDPDNSLHYRNENTGKFKSLGFDISTSVYYFTNFSLKLGFSRIGRNDEAYEKEDYIFSNNFNVSSDINFLKFKSKLSVYYKYSGKYPIYYYNADDEIALGYVNSFHNMDITLSKKFLNNTINASLGVKNLFDNTEIGGVGESGGHGASSTGVSSLVGWGRTFFMSLKVFFVKY